MQKAGRGVEALSEMSPNGNKCPSSGKGITNVVFSCHGIFLGNRKEQTVDVLSSPGDFQDPVLGACGQTQGHTLHIHHVKLRRNCGHGVAKETWTSLTGSRRNFLEVCKCPVLS